MNVSKYLQGDIIKTFIVTKLKHQTNNNIHLYGLGAAADDLCDHPDPGPGPRVDRQQPRPRVRVVQVLHDSHALGQGQV